MLSFIKPDFSVFLFCMFILNLSLNIRDPIVLAYSKSRRYISLVRSYKLLETAVNGSVCTIIFTKFVNPRSEQDNGFNFASVCEL